MKKLLILLNVLIGILIIGACDESQVGYLLTKDAAYEPDTIIIRQTLDPELDAVRIETGAPWVSLKMQGYAGTDPISFSVDGVTSSEGERQPPVPRGSVLLGAVACCFTLKSPNIKYLSGVIPYPCV